MMHAAVLIFALCSAADGQQDAPADACEHGEIRAQSCGAAERFVRAGMREGQTLHIMDCSNIWRFRPAEPLT
jgi:hypothetical protein